MLLSPVWLFATPWTVACQAPLSMEFSGKNMGMGCHFLLQGIFPNPGLLHYRQIFFYHLSHIYLPFIDWSIDWLPSMWPHGYIILQIITQCYFILLLKIAEKQFWYFFKNFGIFPENQPLFFQIFFLPFLSLKEQYAYWKWKWSHSVTFGSFRPHGLWPTRLLHPWDFPDKGTWMGCHFLLQGIFLTQGLNPVSRIADRSFTVWATRGA